MRRPQTAPPVLDALRDAMRDDPERFIALIDSAEVRLDTQYLHWDELRHRPTPNGVSHQAWWAAVKVGRTRNRRDLPIPRYQGQEFSFVRTERVLEALAFVDMHCGGSLASNDVGPVDGGRTRYLISALREEAVQSSLLEGAATTRRQAKEMLREQRTPATQAERMVANNFAALEWIREHLDEPLTVDGLCTLHRIVTAGTLGDPSDEGRVQMPFELRVAVRDVQSGEILHQPPSGDALPAQLDALARFASEEQSARWLHPVERAVVCHFWLGWLHPFVDGNGRLARAVFYWIMLRNGFWFTEYLSLSRHIRRAPAQYARAYLHVETDGGDVTYFLHHQLDALVKAVRDAQDHIRQKQQALLEAETLLSLGGELNSRQVAVVRHALRRDGAYYTFKSHQGSHGISYPTARADLLGLVERGLLVKSRRGRAMVFRPAPGLTALLESS